MRCDCCNRILNDFETTAKSAVTGEYLGTCKKCLDEVGIQYVGRPDLLPEESMDNDDYDEELDDES